MRPCLSINASPCSRPGPGFAGDDAAGAEAELAAGRADLISCATLFVANPDLPARFRAGAALAQPDKSTLYGGGAQGYRDYPAMGVPSR